MSPRGVLVKTALGGIDMQRQYCAKTIILAIARVCARHRATAAVDRDSRLLGLRFSA